MGTATAGRTSAALFLCALWFAGGCAATKLVTQDVAGPDMATISFTRTFSMLAAASPLHLADRGSGATGAALNGQTGAPGAEAGGGSSPLNRPSLKTRVISQVGPGGTLTWHRPPGILRLEATGLHPSIPCYKVEAGKTYAIEYDYRTGRVACFHPSADPAWLRVPTFAAAKAAADRLNLANAEVELTIRMLDWKAGGASWRLLVR